MKKELFKYGNKFEKSIFEYLREKYPEDIVQVSEKDREDLTRDKFTETINYMREGKKVIS
jgi:PHP family Zn ribbon phosphoesterase